MICRSCCSLLESVKSVESPDDKWSLLTFTCQHHHHNQDEENMKHCIISLHPVDTNTPDSMILHYINGSTVSWSLDHAIGKISKWVDWTKIPNSKLPKPVMLEKYWSLDDWEYVEMWLVMQTEIATVRVKHRELSEMMRTFCKSSFSSQPTCLCPSATD